jgi:single-strand selective monofunctional uracil DNA glycosylase
MQLVRITRELAQRVDAMRFAGAVTHVYNPLVYARAPHESYLRRYGNGHKRAVLLGMNPGPFGMAQTGVPFGDVAAVRDWLGIQAAVLRPPHEHPKRPVLGFDCPRCEISGTRLWGWARERFGTAERFFSDFFVINYCPLVFMEDSGKNRTPDKLSAGEREALFAACDDALRAMIDELRPEHVIGVGAFAEQRARSALAGHGVRIATVLHPSPASPRANTGWAPIVEQQLRASGVTLPER